MKIKNKLRFLRLSYFLRKFYSLKFLKYFLNENFLRKKIFQNIFDSGYWLNYNIENNQSRSGNGSNLSQSIILKKELKNFFEEKKIKKILDIGCGDFKWMHSLLGEISFDEYVGIDLVDTLIDQNIKNYQNDKIKFLKKDIVKDDLHNLDDFDFVLIRHVFIHLKNANILKALNKIQKINFKFICITSDPKVKINKDLKTEGRYRDINLMISPFFLENCTKIIKVPVHNDENYVDLNVYDSNDFSKLN